MNFTRITTDQYTQMTRDCTVLKTRRGKPVILQTSDDLIIKHIYYRKGFSSSRIWPYAVRFMNNAVQLKKRGFLVPDITQAYRSKQLNCDILVYPMIPGKSVRQHWREHNHQPLANMPQFIASLHQSGIYFRDLHLENVIVTHGQLALIDLASVKCKRRPLSESMCSRNFKHLFNERDDRPIIEHYGKEQFLTDYFAAMEKKFNLKL